MGVMLIACSAHVYTMPFAHFDANCAEMATLFSTIMVLLVGLGTMQVKSKDGKIVTDPAEETKQLADAENTLFYIFIYITSACRLCLLFCITKTILTRSHWKHAVTVGLFCTMTIVIILRRVGGALLQVRRGSTRVYNGTQVGWENCLLVISIDSLTRQLLPSILGVAR